MKYFILVFWVQAFLFGTAQQSFNQKNGKFNQINKSNVVAIKANTSVPIDHVGTYQQVKRNFGRYDLPYTGRDEEIELDFKRGWVFLRKNVSSKEALFFYYDEYQGGIFKYGYVRNIDSFYTYSANLYTVFAKGYAQQLYGSDEIHRVIGSTKGAEKFKFSAKGFDVSASFNGKDFFHTKQFYLLNTGGIAFLPVQEDDWTEGITARFLSRITLYSNTDNKTIDLRDLGLKTGLTTGSMKGGSTILTVADASSYKVGDRLLIATGGEGSFHGRPAGARGTPGVGLSTWPGKGYATYEELVRANPPARFAWAHNTGLVYEKYPDGWWPKKGAINYRIAMAVPAAYSGTILKKQGNVLTMDVPANVSTTNAQVYFDNEGVVNVISADWNAPHIEGLRLLIPEGKFAFSESLEISGYKNLSFIGAGEGKTVFITPRGVPCVRLSIQNCPGYKQSGISIVGNVLADGFGFQWWATRRGGNPPYIPDENKGPELESMVGGITVSHSDSFHITRTTIKNMWTAAIGMSNVKDGLLDYCKVLHDYGAHVYGGGGWAVVTSDGSENNRIDSIYFESPKIYGFIESFGGRNNKFTRIKAINGRASSNTSANMIIDGFEFRFTKNSRPAWMDISDPVINMNQNTGRRGQESGGTIQNGKIIFEDYLDEEGNLKGGITVQENNANILIRNVHLESKVGYKPGASVGIQLVKSTGTNTKIDGCTAYGGNAPHHPLYGSNIGVQNGTVINCKAGTIAVHKTVTQKNNEGKVVVFD